jgi:dTDP-4-dehydrorhamnose reductase
MKILVTGKDGQLGQSFQRLVKFESQKISTNFNFVFIGREDLDFSESNFIFKYFKKNKYDLILNFAAFTNVDKAEASKTKSDKVNHIAVDAIAQMAVKYKMRLIHISTDFVFDGNSNKPYTETDKTSALNVYGAGKLAGEKALLSKMKSNAIIIRTSGVYSEFGNNFVKTILKLSKKNKNLNVISDQIGAPTYASDLASAIIEIITSDKFISTSKPSEIYHYSNEGEISWYDFAREIVKICNIDCIVNPIASIDYPLPAKRPKFSLLNKQKIETEFGISIIDWRESLSICLKNLQT